MPVYSDLNSISPTTSPLLTEEAAVYQSLFNILNAVPGEIPFVPELGIELEDELFELMDDISALELFRRVVAVIERFETRVTVDSANTQVTPNLDENAFDLLLVYTIQGIEGQKFEISGTISQG